MKNNQKELKPYPTPIDGYKPFCENPVIICNTSLPEYFLTHTVLKAYTIHGRPYDVDVPLLVRYTGDIKTKKQELLKWLRRYIRENQISYFVDSNGDFVPSTMYVECGHCLVCKEKKRKHFEALCSMECQQHSELPLFITLTYNNSNVPSCGLKNKDVQDFFKRVRRGLDKRGIQHCLKYAYCGEYGPKTGRPHYHVLLYGFPRVSEFQNLFKVEEFIKAKWNKGFILLKPCRDSKAGSYVAKYITKQLYVPSQYEVKPFVRHSYHMGVDFVKKTAEKVLSQTTGYTPIYYTDRFSGKLCYLPMTKYYINRLLPNLSKVDSDLRNSFILVSYLADNYKTYSICRSHAVDKDFSHIYRDCVDYRLFESHYDYGTPEEEAWKSIGEVMNYQDTKIDYIKNQSRRDLWYEGLLEQVPQKDPHEKAYELKKRNDYEIAKQID